MKSRQYVEDFLASVDIRVNGNNPWDIRVHDDRFFNRVLSQGSIALGESYMDKWWDCDQLDEFFSRLIGVGLRERHLTFTDFLCYFRAKILNLQTISRSFLIGQKHYDIGNDLYQCMLDKRLIYSCGYWKDASTLDQAQEDKLDLICRKLRLTAGMRVLDIGCGWGGAARFAAERYNVTVVGVTVSQQQFLYAKQHCQGLPVDIRLQDYREIQGTFDRIFSVGMFEHVGCKNYRKYFDIAARLLSDDGLFLLHTIGRNDSSASTDAWISRYIFPNSVLPSITQIGKAIENRFVMENWHNFGVYYDKTLMAWFENFCKGWDRLKAHYNDRFFRMWRYYLLCCAGSFRCRDNQLWQIVLSKKGISGGYDPIY